jgi:hypothetical protein
MTGTGIMQTLSENFLSGGLYGSKVTFILPMGRFDLF